MYILPLPATLIPPSPILNFDITSGMLQALYHISPIISHTPFHERSPLKNRVRLAFEIFVESTVRHAITYVSYTSSHVQVSPHQYITQQKCIYSGVSTM